MDKEGKFEKVYCDVTDTNPKGTGQIIYKENGDTYGFLQPNHHSSRAKPLRREDWNSWILSLKNRIPKSLEAGSFEIVIAAFLLRKIGQRLPDRKFSVLGSFTKEDASKVWNDIQDYFMNDDSKYSNNSSSDSVLSNTTPSQDTAQLKGHDVYLQLDAYCSIHQGIAGSFGSTYSPRMVMIIALLQEYNIEYFVDSFEKIGKWYHNIILPGTSDQLFTAHHDTAVPGDCANDNSCSIFNLIYLKILCPQAYIVFTDAEELGPRGMHGAHRVSELWHKIKAGTPVSIQNHPLRWENMRWIVNLELTGSGGKRFFYSSYPKYRNGTVSSLAANIHSIFDEQYPIQEVDVPFSDSKVFVEEGIDSVVLNPLPPLLPKKKHRYPSPHVPVRAADGTDLDFSIVSLCNRTADRLDLEFINKSDMQEFVEEILVPIAQIC